MSAKKREFCGKEIADAIKNACEAFQVPQEQLDIEVVDTGSTGIFGLIRKKAKIRAAIRAALPQTSRHDQQTAPCPTPVAPVEPTVMVEVEEVPLPAVPKDRAVSAAVSPRLDDETDEVDELEEGVEEGEASPESIVLVQEMLSRLVELMGFTSTVEVTATGLSVECTIKGEFEADLIGPEGKTLDSIQYLIRKMIAKKNSERLRISVNVGDFRERRLEELKVLAVDLARQVKTDGKTQVIPALSPSERREIHIVLQEDKEVRSRSVGDGLFKKILIYKPGKGNRGGKRKSSPRGKRTGDGKAAKPVAEE